MSHSAHRRVALLLNLQIGYCRRAIMGIAAYSRERGWLLEERPANGTTMKDLSGLSPCGVIAHVFDESLGHLLEQLDFPVVSISSNQDSLALPTIDADHEEVGRLAAKYFWELGYRHYAFFGSATASFSRQREQAFVDFLHTKDVTFGATHIDYTLRPPFERHLEKAEESIGVWLAELPKPVAIFCSNDEHARMLSALCRLGKIRVPEDVALLGVDNDETMCLLSSPPLSSVDNPGEEIGFRAAAMLDQMFQTGEHQPPSERVTPIRIIERPSTDRFAMSTPETDKAIAFITRSLSNPALSVDDVAEHVSQSRRSLERTFSSTLGITVLTAIQRARIRKAKSLLRGTHLGISLIATECGFSNHRRFGIVFRSLTEMTPTDFRTFYEFDKR